MYLLEQASLSMVQGPIAPEPPQGLVKNLAFLEAPDLLTDAYC